MGNPRRFIPATLLATALLGPATMPAVAYQAERPAANDAPPAATAASDQSADDLFSDAAAAPKQPVSPSDTPPANEPPATGAAPPTTAPPAAQAPAASPRKRSAPVRNRDGSVQNPDGTTTFDPNDPAIAYATMIQRQRGLVEPGERTLPPWCYTEPLPDPDAPSPFNYGPAANVPCADDLGDALGDRVGESTRWYSHFSYLSLWTDGYRVPALVTTSPAGTLQADAGVLPDATVLFGNQSLEGGQRSGGAVKLGWWLVDGQFMAIEGDYWALARESTSFHAASSFTTDPNAQILARPFFNSVTNQEDAAILAFPNFSRPGAIVNIDGTVDIDSTSDLQSAGLSFRHVLLGDFERALRIDIVGGYRFLKLDEGLQIRDSFFDPGGGLIGPTLRESTDLFDVENDFHGGEVGLSLEMFRNRWSFELLTKVGLGNNHQVVDISGQTTISSLGASATEAGGLLAQPTNIGRYRRDVFMAIPEASIKARYALRDNLELGIGGRILYLDDVVRPGPQIDTTINPSQINGPLVGDARPAHTFVSSDMLLRGVEVSLEYRW
jgi:hypothetical protein